MSLTNDQHIAFCLDYLKHFNGTKAALNSGYSPKTAGKIAWKLLQRDDIQAFLSDKRKQLELEADIELIEIIRHLRQMAFFDIGDILDVSGDILPVHEWPEIARKVVAGIDVEVRHELFDDQVTEIKVKKIKIPSREKNTENLGRYVGAFTDNMKVDTGDGKKYVYVFPGFRPGMPIPAEEDDGNGKLPGDNGNGRPESDGGGNGKLRHKG
jgi:phage terminase small subunit